ncbi:MAG: hypothetical protein LUH22_01250 [Bacteroides sp.]|nr:hypothetical protein [Bacteroides sp.]
MIKKEKLFYAGLFVVGILYLGFTFYPTAIFRDTVEHKNYCLHMNTQTHIEEIKSLIDSVDNHLRTSELYSPPHMHIAFCDNHITYGLLTHISYSSFGVTQLLSNFIILSKTDLEQKTIIANKKGNNQRSIQSVLLHEITHILINNHYGMEQFSINEWKKEGYCEYMAQDSSFDIERGFEKFKRGEIDKNPSYLYFKYRLYVTYLMDIRHMSFKEIVDTPFNRKELEDEIKRHLQTHGPIYLAHGK